MTGTPVRLDSASGAVLSPAALRAWRPGPALGPAGALAAARAAARAAGCAGPGQQLGQRWAVGCVALEITQRCNLDCTLCYLSEHSEAAHDPPLETVFARIDRIRAHYGTGVDVQITGGDPTLRRRDELLAIVRRLASEGQRATLMTNGIRADRALLSDLAAAGLSDVAFHVDTTQRRKGYTSEAALEPVRRSCLERARGIGLSVMFNTTVHAGNLHEVAALSRFFREHAHAVRTASFQLHADTGRGVLRGRAEEVTAGSVWSRIEEGLGTRLRHDASRIGHPRCTRYGLALVAGRRAFDLFDDAALIQRMQAATAALALERGRPGRTARRLARWLLVHPREAGACLAWAGREARRLRGSLLAGRPRTLSFVVHDFMHACALERERIEACVFKVMGARGPLSMCLYNARRDEEILAPLRLADGQRFDPLTGARGRGVQVTAPDPAAHGLKRARGRTRARLLAQREARR